MRLSIYPCLQHITVMVGQGIIHLEVLDQVRQLDVLLAPVGGGGLISGCCIAGHHLQPTLEIFASEPEGAQDVQQSIDFSRIVPMSTPATIVEGLRDQPKKQHIAHLTGASRRGVVSEEEIRLAMRFAFEQLARY